MAGFSQFNPTRLFATQRSSESAPFVVAAMFTSNFSSYAERLKSSLTKFRLDFLLYEVATVHCSISTKGSNDTAFSKPNFINSVLRQCRVPVLYVDIDVVFRDTPDDVFEFRKSGIDFACYNWLNDRASDAYVPAPATINGLSFKKRFYRFSHSVDLFDPSQLIVSGASQYYSPNAIPLLRRWLDEIDRWPEVADDELLDVAYNTWDAKNSVRAHWWDKGYCRYPWWLTTRPIIDHPDFPATYGSARSFKGVAGSERFSSEAVRVLPSQSRFPRDCIIDTKEKSLLQLNSLGEIEVVGLFSDELWVDQIEEPELRIVGNMAPLVPLQRGQSAEQKQKIPRNSPCPCGSGKKYKHCHGTLL